MVNKEIMNEFLNVLSQKTKEKFNKEMNVANVEFSRDGIVKTTTNELDSSGNILKTLTASVDVGFTILESIDNRTNSILNSGDKVKVFYNKYTITNAYIGVYFGK